MQVLKRNGVYEPVKFNKISTRLRQLCEDIEPRLTGVDQAKVAQKVIEGLYPNVSTVQLDQLAAEIANSMSTLHWDYNALAARLTVSNLHKQTPDRFHDLIEALYSYRNKKLHGRHQPIVSEQLRDVVRKHSVCLNAVINHDRDYKYTYFGIKTLEHAYLLKMDEKIVERPQHLLMRVALGIHMDDIDAAIQTYNYMSLNRFTHATPTLLNAGRTVPQMSSCFLMSVSDDVEGIYTNLLECAKISQMAGGIGLNVSNIRGKGAYLSTANGMSNGIVPMLRVYDATARFIDQGGRRPGAMAMYIEPWHVDIFDFLDCKKNNGKEEYRARNLFYALWIPDLFMRRVEQGEMWTLMCPQTCPGLNDVYGTEFEELYESYEREGLGVETIEAQRLWTAIIAAQAETGTPYMLYKDAINRKSNQRNVGTIKGSNLCSEIQQYTEANKETAVCNLASICVNMFVVELDKTYDFDSLKQAVKVVVRNLNKVIDATHYPSEAARRSNMRHRPIGIGVQGLADAFIMMGYPFDSPEARQLNREIFESMYYAALETSCELAARDGPYETYPGSPVSQGILQFDMWEGFKGLSASLDNDWQGLREQIGQYGVRNSLLMAPMPTASTAQIMGNNESIEPITNNVYSRRVAAGEFQLLNRYMFKDLDDLGLWTPVIRNRIIADRGSIQRIPEIPDKLKQLYRTVWEIPQRAIIDMAADRGAYICQSQSLNIHISDPTYPKLTSMHFHGWKKGLKTGMYYLRTKPATEAVQFTVDQTLLKKEEEFLANAFAAVSLAAKEEDTPMMCTPECFSCGS